MPPLSWIFCTSRLLPCREPRALPMMVTSPSVRVSTGWMFSSPPAKAAVLEMRPPFFRYSSVSTSPMMHTSCRRRSSNAASSPACRWALSMAYRARIPEPMEADMVSTTKMRSRPSAAIQAL